MGNRNNNLRQAINICIKTSIYPKENTCVLPFSVNNIFKVMKNPYMLR